MSFGINSKYASPVFKLNVPDDSFKYKPLPIPTGAYPFRLGYQQVLPKLMNDKMTFHLVGDTGTLRSSTFQRVVASEMARQCNDADDNDAPQFLYHLGDVVYNFGEAKKYYTQFFAPFNGYPQPIFAIAGNHDSDVNMASETPYQSLEPFVKVFCDAASRPITFSGDSFRKSNIQPNVYWTFETPLATIIGLHSNVPKFGVVTVAQRSWFADELKAAQLHRPGKAIIVCIHHAPFSADVNHGSSKAMIELLEGVFEETGIKPDIVFSGHVHNYQRFEKDYGDKVVRYIVAGAGGYDELHAIASKSDERFAGESPLFKNVRLLSYCDDKHGFLKVSIERKPGGLSVAGEYYSVNFAAADCSMLEDQFSFMI